MLEPDQWEDVLSKVTGTVYRGTERVTSSALFNALVVGPDPSPAEGGETVLTEPRSVRTSRGAYAGPSFRIAKGVSFRFGGYCGTSESHEELRPSTVEPWCSRANASSLRDQDGLPARG
jgi:hypothetical protein